MDYLSRYPTEIWENILYHVLSHGFLPRSNATLFEDIDVFSHPCKIYQYMITTKISLRLVCRMWNGILQRPQLQVSFMKAYPDKTHSSNPVGYVHRVELIHYWPAYCHQWPCIHTFSGGKECAPKPDPFSHPQIIGWPKLPILTTNLRVLRLLNADPDSAELLRANENLKALCISFVGFRLAYASGCAMRLSHLHLCQILDDGKVHRLQLPQLVYIRLQLHLDYRVRMSERVYPLDVSMPKVSTIHVEGKAYEKYLEAMIQMIFNAKDTIVNLLFGAHGGNKFPWENLDEFPRLETFGFDSSRFSKPLSTMFSVYPLPSSTSLSFIMLEINSHIQSGHWRHCNEDRHNFRDMMSRPGRWVGKVVVPFIWREIEPLWVNAYRAREGDKKEHDAFPCCWPCINYMDTHDIRIEDQNGISLREGDGAQFASRMRTFKHELGAEFNDEEGDGL